MHIFERADLVRSGDVCHCLCVKAFPQAIVIDRFVIVTVKEESLGIFVFDKDHGGVRVGDGLMNEFTDSLEYFVKICLPYNGFVKISSEADLVELCYEVFVCGNDIVAEYINFLHLRFAGLIHCAHEFTQSAVSVSISHLSASNYKIIPYIPFHCEIRQTHTAALKMFARVVPIYLWAYKCLDRCLDNGCEACKKKDGKLKYFLSAIFWDLAAGQGDGDFATEDRPWPGRIRS